MKGQANHVLTTGLQASGPEEVTPTLKLLVAPRGHAMGPEFTPTCSLRVSLVEGIAAAWRVPPGPPRKCLPSG